jgi:hypothetical protein
VQLIRKKEESIMTIWKPGLVFWVGSIGNRVFCLLICQHNDMSIMNKTLETNGIKFLTDILPEGLLNWVDEPDKYFQKMKHKEIKMLVHGGRYELLCN